MKVVVIAATNRPEALDPALCRPGRFSRKVIVGEPDEVGREKILAVHLRELPLEEDLNLICSLVASLTPGYVGADLANIVNEAALLAARRGQSLIVLHKLSSIFDSQHPSCKEKCMYVLCTWKEYLGHHSSSFFSLFRWRNDIEGRCNGSY